MLCKSSLLYRDHMISFHFLQYKREAFLFAVVTCVQWRCNVVPTIRITKEQFNKLRAKKAPVDNRG